MLYSGNKLKEIVFPLGGIGTGCIGLAGNGELVDWEIFNRPSKGTINDYSFFAVKAEYPSGKSVIKILQGDHASGLSGQFKGSQAQFCGYGYGPNRSSMCAFPHFEKVEFGGDFPIATLTFEDSAFPGRVILTAFNPFIPLDAYNSSIPAAYFDIKIESYEDNVKFSVILSVRNPFLSTENLKLENDKYTAVMLKFAGKKPSDKDYGDLTVAADSSNGICQQYWYRGQWQDGVSTFWYELANGELINRSYTEPSTWDVCSVGSSKLISKEKSESLRFVISWNIPNNYNYWSPFTDENGCDITWKNYYATVFKDSSESAFYSLDNFEDFLGKTEKFRDSLHNSTLDKAVIDAVSSTMSVLKSPTVLRLEDGTFYGWEGVHEASGSCEGTCTHVWSYQYALCFLFPELERSIRDTELNYDTDENGLMQFRTLLPLTRPRWDFRPCVDGQMSTLIKIYRDWKLTGNTEWLKDNWDKIKSLLEFAWNENNADEWDKDRDGVLEGRQHHTLDVELFGTCSWLEGLYLAALKATAEMAEYLGDTTAKAEYTELFENGYRWTMENLFNGEYFIHLVDLENKEYTEHFGCPEYWNEEKGQLKYQIGEGSIIDQMLAQWHANISGLGDIFDKAQRKTALENMFKNHFKPSLRDFANTWRVFALNDEGGTVMCDYPEGHKSPVIPIPYVGECMTGFEYAFAGLLVSEGFISEGIKAVAAIRDRYDGEKRNPFNEIECGNNYARAMASFALLPIFSGFEFDMPNNHIGFAPKVSGDFKCFWSVGTGWGDFYKNDKEYRITLNGGSICLKSLSLDCRDIKAVSVDGKSIEFSVCGNTVSFEKVTAQNEILIEVQS